ncbi:hypothetical protein Amme1_00035 [Pseudomonas phage vB_PpuM-Amme-1]
MSNTSKVTALSTFKISKLTQSILDILKKDGSMSLSEYGELPLQVGLATEVLLHADCPANTVFSIKGRSVGRYVELTHLDVADKIKPDPLASIGATSAAQVPAAFDGEIKLMYLAIPTTTEMDADGLLEYVEEMIDTIRESLVSEGYSPEERETLIGVHKDFVEHTSEVHVFIDLDILEDAKYSVTLDEYFEADAYEKFDSDEYDEKYRLPELLRGLPDDVMLQLAAKLDIKKGTTKKSKLTTASITEAILKLDTEVVKAAISELIDPAAVETTEGADADLAETLSGLTAKQLREVAEHMELEVGKKDKSEAITTLILAEEEGDVIDALDALGLLEDETPEGGGVSEEESLEDILKGLDDADVRATAKALKLTVPKKTTLEGVIALLLEEDANDVAEALVDLGFVEAEEEEEQPETPPADDEEEEEQEEEEEEELDTVELENALAELDVDQMIEVAETMELELPKKSTLATLTKVIMDSVTDAATLEAATDAVGEAAGEGEEGEGEEGESLETLYSVLADLKATRGNAATRKEALAEMSETDLTEAKRKDVVALFAIAEMTELDEDAQELIARLAGEESELNETVLGYFTKVFAKLIADDAPEEVATPKPTGKGKLAGTVTANAAKPAGKGPTTRKPASKK